LYDISLIDIQDIFLPHFYITKVDQAFPRTVIQLWIRVTRFTHLRGTVLWSVACGFW